MADIQTLLAQIPAGTQFGEIRDALIRIDRTFPEQLAEIDESRVLGWVQEVEGPGGRDHIAIRNDIFRYIVTNDEIEERLGVSDAEAEALINQTGGAQFALNEQVRAAGDVNVNPEAALSLVFSPTQKWYFDGASNKWYTTYKSPDSNRQLLFEADADQMESLFGKGGTPDSFERKSLSSLTSRTDVTFAGNVAEMEGTGTFEEEWRRMKLLSLDTYELPEWVRADPTAIDLAMIGQVEGKSNEWVIEQISKLPSFQKRFPGIKSFKDQGLSTSEAVGAFLEFETGLKQMEKQFGRSPDRITPDMVGALVGKGYNIEQVQKTYTTFKRMEDYAPALQAFNEILAANGKQPLSGTSTIEFLEGTAPQDVYDIYEASSFRESAETAGLGGLFSAHKAISAALQTPGVATPESITSGMQEAAKLVLRLRANIDLGQFGLANDDLIDMSLGLRPQSGRSSAEIQQSVEQAVTAARAFLQPQATPSTGFSSTGLPQARSLGNLRQET